MNLYLGTFLTFHSELGASTPTSEMRQPSNHIGENNNNFAKNQATFLSVTENHDENSFAIIPVLPEIDLVPPRLSTLHETM